MVAITLVALIGVLGPDRIICELQADDSNQANQAAEKKPAAPSADLSSLKKVRLNAARLAYDTIWDLYVKGYRDEEEVYRWSLRLLEAERQLATKKMDQISAFQGHFNRMADVEKNAPDRIIAVDQPASMTTQQMVVGGFGGGGGKALPKLGPRFTLLIDKNGNTIRVRLRDPRPSDAVAMARFFRAEAEVWLAEAKAE